MPRCVCTYCTYFCESSAWYNLHCPGIRHSVFFCCSCSCTHICSRLSLMRRNKDVLFFFSCEWARDSLWICISAQSVLRRACSHSIWVSTRKSQWGREWACHDVTSPVPPLSSAFSILPLLQCEWKDYSQGKMTFNPKIYFISLPFHSSLPLLPTHFCLYSPCSLITMEIYCV